MPGPKCALWFCTNPVVLHPLHVPVPRDVVPHQTTSSCIPPRGPEPHHKVCTPLRDADTPRRSPAPIPALLQLLQLQSSSCPCSLSPQQAKPPLRRPELSRSQLGHGGRFGGRCLCPAPLRTSPHRVGDRGRSSWWLRVRSHRGRRGGWRRQRRGPHVPAVSPRRGWGGFGAVPCGPDLPRGCSPASHRPVSSAGPRCHGRAPPCQLPAASAGR